MSNKLLISQKNKMKSLIKPDNYNSNNITNIIIGTEQTKKTLNDNIIEKANQLEQKSAQELAELWRQRTNAPYKIIIKNEPHNKEFKTQKDLVIHHVTLQDKEGVEEQYNEKMTDIKHHNNELKEKYTKEKKSEYYQKFMYNNSYNKRNQMPSSDFIEMKIGAENKIQNEPNKITDIIASLTKNGLLENTENQVISGVKIIKR